MIELVQSAHLGSGPAIQEILRRFSPLIRRLAHRMPGPHEEAKQYLEAELALAILKTPPRCVQD